MYRGEVKLRTNLLGEPAKHIRPLSETRCVLILPASSLCKILIHSKSNREWRERSRGRVLVHSRCWPNTGWNLAKFTESIQETRRCRWQIRRHRSDNGRFQESYGYRYTTIRRVQSTVRLDLNLFGAWYTVNTNHAYTYAGMRTWPGC